MLAQTKEHFNDSTIQVAIDLFGDTTEGVIWLPYEEWNIKNDLIIPKNISLKIDFGAVLNIDSSVTVCIKGHLDAGVYQIFKFPDDLEKNTLDSAKIRWCRDEVKLKNGQIDVLKVKSPPILYPEWWGAKGDWATNRDKATNNYCAIQRCFNVPMFNLQGNTIVFQPGGEYLIKKGLVIENTFDRGGIVNNLGSGEIIQGSGTFQIIGNKARIWGANNIGKQMLRIGKVEQDTSIRFWNVLIKELDFEMGSSGYHTTDGIFIDFAHQVNLEGCEIKNCFIGIRSDTTNNNYCTLKDVWMKDNVVHISAKSDNIWKIDGGKFETGFRAFDLKSAPSSGGGFVENQLLTIDNVDFSLNGGHYFFDAATISRIINDTSITNYLPKDFELAESHDHYYRSPNVFNKFLLDNFQIAADSLPALIIKRYGYERFFDKFRADFNRPNEQVNSLIRIDSLSYNIRLNAYFEKNGGNIADDSTRLIHLKDCDGFTIANSRIPGSIGTWRDKRRLAYGIYLENSHNGEIIGNRLPGFREQAIFIDNLSSSIRIENNTGVRSPNKPQNKILPIENKSEQVVNLDALGNLKNQRALYAPQRVNTIENLIPSLVKKGPNGALLINEEEWKIEEGKVKLESDETIVGPDGSSFAPVFTFITSSKDKENACIKLNKQINLNQGETLIFRFWAKSQGFIGIPERTYDIRLIQVKIGSDTQFIDLSNDWQFYEITLPNQSIQPDLSFTNPYSSWSKKVAIWGLQAMIKKEGQRNYYYPHQLDNSYVINSNLIEGPLAIAQENKIYRLFYATEPPPSKQEILPNGQEQRDCWSVGDRCMNSNPMPGSYIGWVYTDVGWRGYGKISEESCPTKEQYLDISNLTVIPEHRNRDIDGKEMGDKDFHGHGPCTNVTVSIDIRDKNKELWLTVNVEMWECKEDKSDKSDHTYGAEYEEMKLMEVESGWRIKKILGKTESFLYNFDEERDEGELVLGEGPVASYIIKGDFKGDDIGKSEVELSFKRIKVILEKCN